MTEQTPGAELERRTEAPVSRADTDSWTTVVGVTARLAQEIAGTEFVPRDLRGKPAAVTAAILYGREIGLPPMTALTQTHVIEGKPAASAEAMRALVLAAGHELVIVETTGSICTMRARRRGSSTWTDLSWTLDMARAAGLYGGKKDNWQKYPRAMLQARCSAELIRLVFPDVVLGMVALEELDVDDTETPAETTVSRAPAAPAPRKRAAKKAAAAPPADSQPAPAAPGGMPLPGEDGYVETRKPPEDAPPADLPAEQTPSGQTPTEEKSGPESGSQELEEARDAAALEAELDEDGAVEADVVEDRTHKVYVTQGPVPVYTCSTCGYRGETAPELPCPGPPEEPEAHEEERPAPARITPAQVRMISARINGLGKAAGVVVEDEERRGIVRVLAGREEPIGSTKDLSKHEGSAVIDTLTRVDTLEDLYGLVEATVEALRQADPS